MLWINCGKQNPSPHTKSLPHTQMHAYRAPCVLLFFAKGQIQITEPLQEEEIRGALGKEGGRCCIFLTVIFIRFLFMQWAHCNSYWANVAIHFYLKEHTHIHINRLLFICVSIHIYVYLYANLLQNISHFAYRQQNGVISNSSAWCSNSERHTTPPRTFPSDLGSSCAAARPQAWGPGD